MSEKMELKIDRITGAYNSIEWWWNSQDMVVMDKQLSGVCIAQKKKF